MNYRKRSNNYLFTVTYTGSGSASFDQSETFFKELRKVNHTLGKGQLFRMGRKRDRSTMTDRAARGRGHVPINVCDRFDVYVRINTQWDLSELQRSRARQLITAATALIQKNWDLIEYCNDVHKDLFDTIFYPKTKIEIVSIPATNENKFIAHKVTEIMKPYTPNYTNWNVKLTAKVRCVGPGVVADVERFFNGVTGLSEVVLTDAVPIDEHKDLPLVMFSYPYAGAELGDDLAYRSIRVTKMDDTYLEGFDGQQFKKFRKDRIVGPVKLVELAGKQD